MARTSELERFRIQRLANYNSETGRGLVHTRDWTYFMVKEQMWYDNDYMPHMWAERGYEPDPDSKGPFIVYRKVKQSPWWRRLL
jgi:hypothetical protein